MVPAAGTSLTCCWLTVQPYFAFCLLAAQESPWPCRRHCGSRRGGPLKHLMMARSHLESPIAPRALSSISFSSRGGDRVRSLDLLAQDRTGPARRLPGSRPAMLPPMSAELERADSEFAVAARKQLRSHVDRLMDWVVVAVRGTRRNLRRKFEEAANTGPEGPPALTEAWVSLLQQICDERLWRRHESECVTEIERAHNDRVREATNEASGQRGAAAMWHTAKMKTLKAVQQARQAAEVEAAKKLKQQEGRFMGKQRSLAMQMQQSLDEKREAQLKVTDLEDILKRGGNRDQEKLLKAEEENKRYRNQFLALSERVQQLTVLKEENGARIGVLEQMVEDREKRIRILEGNRGRRS